MNINKDLTSSISTASTVMVPSANEATEPTQAITGKFGYLQRAVQVTQAAANVVKFVGNEGHNGISGATAVIDGFGDMLTLSPFGVVKGGVKVVSGCLTIRDAWGRVFGRIDNLDQLLTGAQASLDAIEFYGELNQEEAETIKAKANDLKKDYEALVGQLKSIKNIADHGNEEIKKFKEEAASQIINALEQIEKAKKSFEIVQKEQKAARVFLNLGKDKAQEMLNLSQSAEGTLEERFEQFQKLAQECPDLSEKALKYLTRAQKATNDGLAELDKAREIQAKALLALANVEKVSEVFAQEIKAQTLIGSLRVSIEEKIEKIQECAQKIIDNIEDEFVIIDNVKEDLEDLRNEVNKRWTNGAVAVGLVTVAVAPLGPVGKVAAGYAAAAAWTNKESIRDGVEKVFAKPFPVQKPQVQGLLTFKFNDKSTGWANRYFKKQASKTCGDLKIDLGNGKTFDCQVNFNSKRDAIRTESLVELNKTMYQGLKDGSMSPERCLEIIQQLRTEVIDRGSEHNEGHFITKNCPYISAVERLAQSMLNS